MKALLSLVLFFGLVASASAAHFRHREVTHEHGFCPACPTPKAAPKACAPVAKPAPERVVNNGKVYLLDPKTGGYYACPNCKP